MFTKEELTNIAKLIEIAPIKGSESVVVAQLLIKIDSLLKETPKKEEVKEK